MPSTWFNLDPNSWDVFFCSYFLWLLSPPIGIGLGISFLGHSTCCSSATPWGFWAFILWCAAAGMFLAPEQPDGSGIPFHHWICMVSWNQQLPNDPLKCIGSLGNLTVHNNTPLLLVCSKKVSFFFWKTRFSDSRNDPARDRFEWIDSPEYGIWSCTVPKLSDRNLGGWNRGLSLGEVRWSVVLGQWDAVLSLCPGGDRLVMVMVGSCWLLLSAHAAGGGGGSGSGDVDFLRRGCLCWCWICWPHCCLWSWWRPPSPSKWKRNSARPAAHPCWQAGSHPRSTLDFPLFGSYLLFFPGQLIYIN